MDVPERTVVVVHGIGQQAAGATATAWIESFLRFCRAQGRRAEVVQAKLADDDGPARAVLAVGAPGTWQDAVVVDPVLRLRIVEARWSEAFVAPGAFSVLRWLLWYGPNLAHAQVFLGRRGTAQLHAQAARVARRTLTGRHDEPGPSTGEEVAHQTSSSLSLLSPVLYLLLGLVLLAVAGPIVVVLAVLAALAALVPSRTVRGAATRALSIVSAQIGDVSTYLTSPVSRGAMEDIIDECIRAEVAAAGREDVHVVAHSQGAALSHAVLARMPAEHRPRRFTTLGGAHGRLHDMRLLQFPAWTLVPILATVLSWLFAFPIHGRFGWTGLAVAPGAVSVVTLVVLLLVGRASVRALGAEPSPGRLAGVRWLDLWAPFDPVHNARPVQADPDHDERSPDEPPAAYLGQTVPGRMAFLLDHVFYEKDWHETVPRVLARITEGLPDRSRLGATRGVRARKNLHDPDGVGPNWTPWSRRDWLSFACRLAAVVVGVTLVVGAGEKVMALGHRLRGIGTWADDAATWAGEQWGRWWALLGGQAGDVVGGTDRVIGGAVVLAAAILVANVVKALYWAAVTAEARSWARSLPGGGEPERWSEARWWVRGGAIAVVAVGLVGGFVALVALAPWA